MSQTSGVDHWMPSLFMLQLLVGKVCFLLFYLFIYLFALYSEVSFIRTSLFSTSLFEVEMNIRFYSGGFPSEYFSCSWKFQ